jgi:hypothetical protein
MRGSWKTDSARAKLTIDQGWTSEALPIATVNVQRSAHVRLLRRQGKLFFLKKRTKKLLSVSGGSESSLLGAVQRAIRTEHLPFFQVRNTLPTAARRG